MHTLLTIFDLAGTFVFALSGADAGAKHRFDLFGVLVLAYLAATAGGITRDLLLGAVPPASVSDWRYIAVPLLAGLVVFRWHLLINRLRSSVLIFDAAGLALFAVSGAQKALAFRLNPLAAVLLGVLTCIGGGVMRDLLVREAPAVLTSEVYAVAGLAGAGVVVLGDLLRLPSAPVALVGAGLCFGLRLGAIRRGWELPRAHTPEPTDPGRADG